MKQRIAELRDWLATASGKLAATASVIAGALAFVSQDPSVALVVSGFLPFPLNLILIVLLMLVAYVLPHWASKKDGCDGE